MARDISYCSFVGCVNCECMRHQSNLKAGDIVSVTSFPECEYYKAMLRKVAEQDKQDAINEALREAHRLDDNEDTLAYKGRI